MYTRMMHLTLFLFGCGHHRGAWRHPHSSVERLGDIRYYEPLTQTAERGKLDAVFLADGHAVGHVAGGSAWFLEPLTVLVALRYAKGDGRTSYFPLSAITDR
jgi:alkanesulfonate monooxygenase SsuD/methylene tetrahydromethanopterin reductase-like flavin-dependent oxidoreductase (luciferase family)